jgi:1-acyl-sn-glycerol-3-phosphate acyltransferase
MRLWYRCIRGFADLVLRVVAEREVHGLERLPTSGPILVAANHGSFWDPPVLGVALPRELHYMAKAELFEVPVFGSLIRSLNAVPIRRGVADLQGIARAREVLAGGGALLVFPEGGRMKDGRLHPARPGLGLLESHARVPIVPVYVSGTNHIRRCVLRLEKVRITVGEPLPETLWFPTGESTTPTAGRALYQAIGDRVMQEIALLRQQEETTRSGAAPATTTSQRAGSTEQGETPE